ncbi:MAG TPA: hypothetical protein VMU45_09325 [Candidatus Eisenbacteria bacterium]|nr:hypothetical protein [Candidatus Eisenbacteria bacterium]
MTTDQYLERELETVIEAERTYGWQNYRAHEVVAILSLVGSVAASVLVAVGSPKLPTALCAAVPATVLAISKVFPFESRAFAHWRKQYRVHALLLRLRVEGVDAKKVSQEFRDLEARAFEGWVYSDLERGQGAGSGGANLQKPDSDLSK